MTTETTADAGATVLPRLPTNPRGLTPDVVNALIARRFPGTKVASVDLMGIQGIDEKMVSTTGRGKIRLNYAENPHGLPENVLVKMIVDEKTIAPPFMFECEVRMYQKMLDRVPIEKPVCLAAEYETDTQNFVLMLEDLTVRGAKFTFVLEPTYTPEQVGVLLDWLATLHAYYWESPELVKEKAWLSSLTEGPYPTVFDDGFIVPVMAGNLAVSPYRRDFITRVGYDHETLWKMVKAVHKHHQETIPTTLLHGDTGMHNTYMLPDGTGGFLDWQFSCRSAWPQDVHYLIVTSMSVKDRRQHERALVQRYIDKLASLGVNYKPDIQTAMDAYSLGIAWGMTVGWFAVPSDMYGMDIISANMERLFAAASDHQTFQRAEKLL